MVYHSAKVYSTALFSRNGFLPKLSTNQINPLRQPTLYQLNFHELDDSYLEKLIQTNIYPGQNELPQDHIRAIEARALINSLSEEQKTKFIKVVKAFDLDKENLDKIKGMIIAGGEIRVIASSGIIMVINVLTQLLGIKLKQFHGTSAGSIHAASQAVHSLNSCTFKNSADTNFIDYVPDRKKLEREWILPFLIEGYQLHTGKKTSEITREHLDELGTEVHLYVAELPRRIFPFNYLNPDVYPLPNDIKSMPIAYAASASSNMPGLFFNPLDKTFGNCSHIDNDGKKHYVFDPGLHPNHSLPVEFSLAHDIQRFKKGLTNAIPFYFIVGNKRVKDSKIPEKEKREFYKNTTLTERAIINLSKFIDKFCGDPRQKVEEIGAQRAYVEATCITKDPSTGEIAMLNTGNLNISKAKREVLICANIPTKDFKDLEFQSTIDQLYENLVDEEYIRSNGKKGLSPYQKYFNDIVCANDIKMGRLETYPSYPWISL
ncbi:MAG: hypothetical protein HYY52_06400 [Candidatus Melainabacteria bacterium]|nr:hypothetical protein [Candidatus Melainabacteria bacterium]